MDQAPVAAPAVSPERYAWRLSAAAQVELVAGAPAVHAGPPAVHGEPHAVHTEPSVAPEPAMMLVADPSSAPHDWLLLEQPQWQTTQSAVQNETGQSAPCLVSFPAFVLQAQTWQQLWCWPAGLKGWQWAACHQPGQQQVWRLRIVQTPIFCLVARNQCSVVAIPCRIAADLALLAPYLHLIGAGTVHTETDLSCLPLLFRLEKPANVLLQQLGMNTSECS